MYLSDMPGLEVLQRLHSDGDRVGAIMITAARELDTVKGALGGGGRRCSRLPDQTIRVQPTDGELNSYAGAPMR
ncbi:hypothetical protein AU188_15580 [Mycobacterium sp. IS-3022]|nr:hypothetical protein AU188_15580 [Mycobacterium sp. IS-3022]